MILWFHSPMMPRSQDRLIPRSGNLPSLSCRVFLRARKEFQLDWHLVLSNGSFWLKYRRKWLNYPKIPVQNLWRGRREERFGFQRSPLLRGLSDKTFSERRENHWKWKSWKCCPNSIPHQHPDLQTVLIPHYLQAAARSAPFQSHSQRWESHFSNNLA